MRIPKRYESKAWLTREYKTLGKSPEEIARQEKVEVHTIYRYMDKHGIRRAQK